MNECGRNESDISRYTDVEYSPEGYKTVYRWGDFLEIARGHVYNAMDTRCLLDDDGDILRACSALSRASAYLASARRLAPYRPMYFAAFAV